MVAEHSVWNDDPRETGIWQCSLSLAGCGIVCHKSSGRRSSTKRGPGKHAVGNSARSHKHTWVVGTNAGSLSKHVCGSYRINYEWMGRTDSSSYVPCHKLMTVAGCGWSNHQIHKKRASFACLSSYMLRVDNKPTCNKIQCSSPPHHTELWWHKKQMAILPIRGW